MIDAITRTDTMMASLGLEVYRVGGSVRDEIMGRTPKDADYMVRGIPLLALNNVLREKGLKFKALVDRNRQVLGVRLDKGGVEITLPRKEISTGPLRTDFEIVLDPDLSIAEDAKRRDFTFNALYKHLDSGEIGDPTSCGLYDLQHRFIRTTHSDSFRDDPLRILRALRFVATLGYDLAVSTRVQMRDHADAVDGFIKPGREQTHTIKFDDGVISRKRMPGDTAKDPTMSGTVLDEFNRILMGPYAVRALREAASSGVLGNVFPELAPMIGFDQGSKYHDLTTDEHTFTALETAAKVDAPLRVRWALLFHDAGKPESAWMGPDGRKHYYAKTIGDGPDRVVKEDHEVVSEALWRAAAGRMNVPRELREDVARLIRNHMVACSSKIKRSKVHRARIDFGDDFLSDLYLHRMCDLAGKGKANRQHMANVAAAELLRKEAQKCNVPRSTKDLAIDGNDAKSLGMTGHWIGGVLSVILDDVACDPSPLKLSREWQMKQLEQAAQHRAGIDRAIERGKAG